METETRSLPRMRTAKGCYDMIHLEDPGSEISLSHIVKIIKSGKVPVSKVGVKTLVNYDNFIQYLFQDDEIASNAYSETNGIRRIKE